MSLTFVCTIHDIGLCVVVALVSISSILIMYSDLINLYVPIEFVFIMCLVLVLYPDTSLYFYRVRDFYVFDTLCLDIYNYL